MISLLVTYRKQLFIALAVLVVFTSIYVLVTSAIEHFRAQGRAEADAKWTQVYNAEIAARNKKIQLLEEDAISSVKKLDLAKDTAQKMLAEVYAQWKKDKASDKAKVVVNCPPVPSSQTPSSAVPLKLDTKDIILPESYVRAWNDLNLSWK